MCLVISADGVYKIFIDEKKNYLRNVHCNNLIEFQGKVICIEIINSRCRYL